MMPVRVGLRFAVRIVVVVVVVSLGWLTLENKTLLQELGFGETLPE